MKDKVSLATLALAKEYTDSHGGGGGGTDNYNDLTHLPTVNGTEFKGTMTGATIGLVDAVSGKGLSTNDYTDAEKTKLSGIATGAEVNVQSDWNQTTDSADDFIKNKPDLTNYVQKSNTEGLLKNDGTVDTTTYIPTSTKGANNGVASLDNQGIVPIAQIPIYVNTGSQMAELAMRRIWVGDTQYYIPDAEGAMIASYFFDADSYAVGDYVIQYSRLYRCTTAHTGAWNDNDFTLVALADEVTNIKDGASIDSFGDVETALAGKQATLTFDNTPTNGSNNPVKSDGIYDAIQDVYEVNGVLGAKNLLSMNLTSGRASEVDFTVNSDGSITLDGTSSAWFFRNFNYVAYEKSIPTGTYKISGAMTNVTIKVYADGTAIQIITGNEEKEFTITDAMQVTYARFEVDGSKTFDNATFYPMIRLASDTDATFQPYAMTNKELTDEKFPRSEQAVLGAKNYWSGDATPFTLVKSSARTKLITGRAIGTGRYKFSCVISDAANMSKNISVQLYHDSNYVIAFTIPNTNGYHEYEFEIPTGNVDYIETAYIFINSADNENATVTISNIMIRLASDTDSTYQPYAQTNKELTENVTPKNVTVQVGTDIELRPANMAKMVGNLLCLNLVIKNTGTGNKTSSDTLVTISGLNVTHSNNLVCLGVKTGDGTPKAFLLTHDSSANTIVVKILNGNFAPDETYAINFVEAL